MSREWKARDLVAVFRVLKGTFIIKFKISFVFVDCYKITTKKYEEEKKSIPQKSIKLLHVSHTFIIISPLELFVFHFISLMIAGEWRTLELINSNL